MAKKLPKGYVRVEAGESWASLAGKYTGDQRNFLRLMEANGGYLRPGDIIKIPGSVKDGPAYIGNKTAASFGLATSDQLKDAYAANGTGGYNSERLPMGGYRGGDAMRNAPGATPAVGSAASGLAPVGYGNNAAVAPGLGTEALASNARRNAIRQGNMLENGLPGMGAGTPSPAAATPAPAYAGGVTGVAPVGYGNNQQGNLQPLEIQLSPGYRMPNTGQSSAQAMRNASAPPQQRAFNWQTGIFDAQGQPHYDQIGTVLGSWGEQLTGKTTLAPGEAMSNPYATPQGNGTATSPNMTGQPQGAQPVQYTSQQIGSAKQKFTGGFATVADISVLRNAYIADGGDPKVFDSDPRVQAVIGQSQNPQAMTGDSATSGWNWNEPTASGYVSPSGYFVPYAKKTNFSDELYDPETGRIVGGGGGRRRLVPGVEPSNLRYGLITWRY